MTSRNIKKPSARLCLLLALALVWQCLALPLAAWAEESETDAPAETAARSLRIDNEEEFLQFAQDCTLDTWSQGLTVQLTADLDLTGLDFDGVPTFGGVFEGAGHTIAGLNIESGGAARGLFRTLQPGSVVRGLTVRGTAGPGSNVNTVGLLVGENHGTVEECSTHGTTFGADYIGGVAGVNQTDGVIVRCYSYGLVYGQHFVGGVTGENRGVVQYCTNEASINTVAEQSDIAISDIVVEDILSTESTTTVTDLGGIAGKNSGVLQNCQNNAQVGYPHANYNVGGIAGSQTGYLSGCVNNGAIYGRKDVGGIVGQMEPNSELDYSQSTLQKLSDQLSTLSQLTSKAIRDASSSSAAVRASLTDLQNNVSSAVDAISAMLRDDYPSIDIADLPTITIPSVEDWPLPTHTPWPTKSPRPTAAPTATPTAAPTAKPTVAPTEAPTPTPTPATNETAGRAAARHNAPALLTVAAPESATAAAQQAQETVQETAQAAEYQSTPAPSSVPVATLTPATPSLSPLPTLQPGVIGDTIKDLTDKIKQDVTGKIDGVIDDVNDELLDKQEQLGDSLDDTVDSVEDAVNARLTAAGNTLSGSFAGIDSSLTGLNDQLGQTSDVLLGDLQAIADQFELIANTVNEAQNGEDLSDRIQDVSDEDTDGDLTGKVTTCVNAGAVSADRNVGGIVGSMGVENSLDPEDDLKEVGDTSANFIYRTRVVLRSCDNSGPVEGKRDNVGGVVGSAEMGAVLSCTNRGAVSSTDGDCVGGVAGTARATLRDCSAKCTLSGEQRVGGIAGQADQTVQDCRAMVQIAEAKAYRGSIAGAKGEDAELTDNYFVQGGEPGVDGVSYSGQAEPLDYRVFVQLPELSALFARLRLEFVVEGAVYTTLYCDYGDDLPDSAIPAVPEKQGYSGRWQDFVQNNVTCDQRIEAEYSLYTTALAADSEQDGKPQLLVEGVFEDGAALTVEPESELSLPDGAAYAWRYSLTPNDGQNHRLHYLLPEDISRARLWLWDGSRWQQAECQTDGSYLLFEAPAEGVFCVGSGLTGRSALLLPVCLGAGAVLLLLALGVHHGKKKRRAAAAQPPKAAKAPASDPAQDAPDAPKAKEETPPAETPAQTPGR